MHVSVDAIIKGAGFFNDSIDGKDINVGQIFIEEPFDASQPRYKGFRTVEYKCVDADVVTPVMHLPFPISAKVDMEISATKRGQVIVVKHIKPIDRAMPTPAPKQATA